MKILNCLFNLLLLLCSVCPSTPPSKLLGVVEIFRHGARAPLAPFSPNQKLYFGAKRTQLTINGFRQHILLGKWLRRRYVYGDVFPLFDLQGPKQGEVKVFASPTQRAIFSAAAHYLGFFPSSTIKVNFLQDAEIKTNDAPPMVGFKLRKRYPDIEINVMDPKNENLFKVRVCRLRGEEVNLWNRDPKKDIFTIEEKELRLAVDHILARYSEFYQDPKFLNEYLSSPEKKYRTITLKHLVDVLRQFKYHNMLEFSELDLEPEVITTIKKNRLNYFYNHRLEESESKKLYVSHMFSLIRDFIKSKVNSSGQFKNTKLLAFSGHDNNIADVLSNILDAQFLRDKIFNAPRVREDYYYVVPPLASSIVIEIHEGEEGVQLVKLLYNGEAVTSHFSGQVREEGKEGMIVLGDFLKLIESRISEELGKVVCGP